MRAAVTAWAGELARACRVSLRSVYSFGTVPATVAQVVVTPVLNALLYLMLAWDVASDGGPEGVAAAALAAAVGACSARAIESTTTIFMSDRYEGALPFVLTASGRTGTVLAVRLICGMGTGVVSCVPSLVVLWVSGALAVLGAAEAAALAVVVLASAAVSAAVGLLVYSVSLTAEDELLVLNVFGYVLPLACGSVAAVSSYPGPVQALCSLVPVSGVTEAVRALAEGDIVAALAAAGAAVALGAIWLIAGLVVLRVGERRQRRLGRADVLGL